MSRLYVNLYQHTDTTTCMEFFQNQLAPNKVHKGHSLDVESTGYRRIYSSINSDLHIFFLSGSFVLATWKAYDVEQVIRASILQAGFCNYTLDCIPKTSSQLVTSWDFFFLKSHGRKMTPRNCLHSQEVVNGMKLCHLNGWGGKKQLDSQQELPQRGKMVTFYWCFCKMKALNCISFHQSSTFFSFPDFILAQTFWRD